MIGLVGYRIEWILCLMHADLELKARGLEVRGLDLS